MRPSILLALAAPSFLRSGIWSLLLWCGPPVEPEIVEIVPAPVPERALEPSVTEPPPAAVPVEPPEPTPVGPPNLHLHWEVDLPLLLGAGAIWLGTEMSLDKLVPAQPRWTEATAAELALRDTLTWRSPAPARALSDAIAYGVVPLFGLTLTLADVGRSQQWRVLHEDLIITLEAVAVATMLSQAIKLSAARGRPYTYEVYHGDPDQSVDRLLVYEPDAFMSFPSGHATLASAFVASFATVATMRKRKLAPYLWGFGMPLSGLVSYLRVAGYRHWFGDVVIGSTVGTVVGAGLPLLLHHPRFGLLSRLTARKQRMQLSVMPSATGATVLGRF
jgi:membrane-associated phospholipid phosphatase